MVIRARLCTSLNIIVAIALLAGCGGSQPPISAPGAVPQTSAIAQHVGRGKSWMLPAAKNQDLIYVSNSQTGEVLVFSFPKAKLVGSISGVDSPAGLCADSSGNVYVTTQVYPQSYIYEYPHGGAQPVKTLTDPGLANGCAVDPVTGNLAVTNSLTTSELNGDVAVFQSAQGSPTTYADNQISAFEFCTYDSSGDLFADGSSELITELPYGSNTLINITLNENIDPSGIQWANSELNIAQSPPTSRGAQLIYPVQVSGSSGNVGRPIALLSKGNRRVRGDIQFWIQGNIILGPGYSSGGHDGRLQLWHYPQGGKTKKSLKTDSGLFGVTVSLAPRR